jgi:hypothetical protein
MLHTDRLHATTRMPDRCAAARNVFITLWPKKSVSKINNSVPVGNIGVFF